MNDEWKKQANCVGKATELFEYQEKDSPLAVGMNFRERLALNETNFQLAEDICIECPVMFVCRDKADDDEKFWTVRGGAPPKRYDEEKVRYDFVGRKMGGKNAKPFKGAGKDRYCHVNHLVPGGGPCLTCKKARTADWQRRNRKALREAKAALAAEAEAV